MPDKPLHVRVAEALGWAGLEFLPPKNSMNMADKGSWVGYTAPAVIGEKIPVPLYDTAWQVAGPWIEKCVGELYDLEDGCWVANEGGGGEQGVGFTPLIAVCHLILNLKKAGKLAA